MREHGPRKWDKDGPRERRDTDLTPRPEDRWFPEDAKPTPLAKHFLADRRLPDGTEVMHPVRGVAAFIFSVFTANQALNDLPKLGHKLQDQFSAREAQEVIGQSAACTNHFSKVNVGFCVTAKDHTLVLAEPSSENEDEDRHLIERTVRLLSPEDFRIVQDKKGKRRFISLKAKDDQQLADWLVRLKINPAQASSEAIQQ